MYGRETTVSRNANQVAPTPPSVPGAAQLTAAGRVSGDPEKTAVTFFPFVLLGAVALYFVWAILEQHQRIKSALKPQAIGINLRNLAVILATVILGLNLFKIGAVKYSGLTGGRLGGRLLVYLAGGA